MIIQKIQFLIFSVVTVVLSSASFLSSAQNNISGLDRIAYYAALSGNDMLAIEKQLRTISHSRQVERDAFEGALKMKKAALLKGAANKLKEFKEGREKLENMITRDSNNVEFRLLRLIIQEKAPKMLHYNMHTEEDHQFIIVHFNTTSKSVRKAILDYSRSSNFLSPEDF